MLCPKPQAQAEACCPQVRVLPHADMIFKLKGRLHKRRRRHVMLEVFVAERRRHACLFHVELHQSLHAILQGIHAMEE